MHFFAPDKNYWGGHGIVGGQTPLGLGLAYGIKYKGLKGAALCFLGDGAVNQGCFYECLNMAALFDLPVDLHHREQRLLDGHQPRTFLGGRQVPRRSAARLFASIGSRRMARTSTKSAPITQKAIERAHKESRPTIIEFDTYRYYGHSVADAKHKGGYRTEEEIEKYKNEHDPIQTLQKSAHGRKGSHRGAIRSDRRRAAKAEADAAAHSPRKARCRREASIFEDVYFEVDRQTEAGRTGRHFFND